MGSRIGLPHLGLLLAVLLPSGCSTLATAPVAQALAGYRLDTHLRVQGVRDNLSGLAYDPGSRHLLAVVNNPATLLELDRRGQVLRRIVLDGFIDTEGVALLADGRVAVTEELLNQIALFTLPPDGVTQVAHATAVVLPLHGFARGNDGLEGLAYDARSDCLWTVKEHHPRALYQVCGRTPATVQWRDRSAWLDGAAAGTDLSGIEIDPVSGDLLLLSDESHRVTALDRHGHVLAQRVLGGPHEPRPPQPEGIAIDADGTLYVASEPDHLYRFRPPRRRHGSGH